MSVADDIEKVLLTAEELDELTTRLAAKIDRDYPTKRKLILVGILKGSFIFLADLARKLSHPVEFDFIRARSYGGGTTSSGTVVFELNCGDIKDADVLVVEDILDSGRTLAAIRDNLADRGAHSVRVCVLLDKPSRRVVEFKPDYIGAAIPDEFVVGYGLDYDERYRHLPYIGVLKSSVYR